MLGIYNPEIPVQSAAPISVLLDNLAVPSEARIRSICFPRSHLPGIWMRLDGFPASALAARAASGLCSCSFQKTHSKNCRWTPWPWGAGDSAPSGQAGNLLGLEVYSRWRGFQKRTWDQEQGAHHQLQTGARNKRQKPPDGAGSTLSTQ